LAAHELAVSLVPDKSRVLPMFHALTGCDTVSSFIGHGKRTAWATWKAMPELTKTLLDMSSAPDDVPDDGTRVIERFDILMYDRTSSSHDVPCTEENRREEELSAKHSANPSSSGAACEEGSISGRSRLGTALVTPASTAFSNKVRMGPQ
jgi:hypothetical protein